MSTSDANTALVWRISARSPGWAEISRYRPPMRAGMRESPPGWSLRERGLPSTSSGNGGRRIETVWMRGAPVRDSLGPGNTGESRYLLGCATPTGARYATSSDGVLRARPRLRPRHLRRVRTRRPHRLGGVEAVIVFDVLSAVLAVATLAYLVYALVKPEKF